MSPDSSASSITHPPLPPEEMVAAVQYLKEFPKATSRKGLQYYRDGRLTHLWRAKDGVVEAFVTGNLRERYEVSLIFEDGFWDGVCSCPAEFDCKHAYAAALSMVESGVSTVESELPAPKAPEPSPKKPVAAPVKPPGTPWERDLETRLGRPLTDPERKVARIIPEVQAASRTDGQVPESVLAGLYGPAMPWSWHMYRLWPKKPASTWETWLYLAHFLRGKGKPWPPFLAGITTADDVDRLVGPWEREQVVKQWKARLQELHAGAGKKHVASVELRVVFSEEAASLETLDAAGSWMPLAKTRFQGLERGLRYGEVKLTPASLSLWHAFYDANRPAAELPYREAVHATQLEHLLRNPLLAPRVLSPAGAPFHRPETPLRWLTEAPKKASGDYRFLLAAADGSSLPPPLLVVQGSPALYVTADSIFEAPALGGIPLDHAAATAIPAAALESAPGVAMLDLARVELPAPLAARVERCHARLVVEATLNRSAYDLNSERVEMHVRAEWGGFAKDEVLRPEGWVKQVRSREETETTKAEKPARKKDVIHLFDRSRLADALDIVSGLSASWSVHSGAWEKKVTKKFPEQFSLWLLDLPEHVELRLDRELASLRDQPVSGSVRLDVEPAGVDWFDLSVELSVPDLDLTPEELKALLSANGGWVRMGKGGWRRLALALTAEEDESLAELGLSPRDLASGEKQRLHALQLAHGRTGSLLTADRTEELRLRVNELKERVSPEVPPDISASLRPYQVEGFHFLAYLSTNRFGGLLADDMGLGKTVQTLTWLLWLRAQPGFAGTASLVVCPKSVMDNWRSEAGRFAVGLRVLLWRGKAEADLLRTVKEDCDLLVINYSQLRILQETLQKVSWHAVILDEAQAIKNPDSQSARAACALPAEHRLALTGTPIENRLLDLWSIMAFAMPGMLGQRARFNRTYDQREDPLARRRLAARTRPFLLRRTKEQVARDLPARVEEDLLCEMEGHQATLYQAELKRARKALLGLKTERELDKMRFHILTSLLRLRQICCHPALVDKEAIEQPSAKLEALMDLLEPLMEEGRKVLVFSQFVGVIEILQGAIEARAWPYFVLTGQTEDRGELIERFQASPGAGVFLLSLKASSFGLNLTAASYVVLYDPWWNPAVENQAIDRTHRIGQTSTVFAYRLLVKGSIEEKIRLLQKQKRALADDLLGEEAFARALTLSDLRLLLEAP